MVHVIELAIIRGAKGGFMYLNLQLLGGPQPPWPPSSGAPDSVSVRLSVQFFHPLPVI